MEEKNRTPWHVTRLVMLLCWLVWILTFFISVTLFQAVLQVHVVAQVAQAVERGFISFNDDFTQFMPLSTTTKRINKKMDEMMLRYYLEMRYSIVPDEREMTWRWKRVVPYLSTPSVYSDFGEPDALLSQVDGLRPRTVDITRVEPDPKGGNEFKVYMDVYEYDNFRKWVKRFKYLTIRYAYMPSRASLRGIVANPNGFVITHVDDRKTAPQ